MASYDVDRDLLAVSLDSGLSDATVLFRKLLTNNDFRNQFINRFADHLNTTFVPARMETIINQMSSAVSSEVVKHISRWGYPVSLNDWTYTVNSYKTWSEQRPDIVRQQIVNQLGLAGTYALTLHTDASNGAIKVNSMEINQDTPGVIDPNNWSGVYFKGVPIQLQAIPQSGYQFAGWTGIDSIVDDTSKTNVTLTPDSDIIVSASFIKESQDNCFIATAAFGSKFAPAVSLLRKFRDDFLMNSDWGRRFVNFYYKNSPPIARFIAQKDILRLMVRILLIPLIVFVYLLYRPFYAITILLMILFLYMVQNKYRVRRTSN